MAGAGSGARLPGRLRARVVVVGDEVLDGFVAEANAAWLAGRLRGLGARLDRVAVVPDDVDVIADEVRRGLAAPRPSIVLTTGGVGGTWDDVTYLGVARALGVGLVVDRELAAPVEEIIDWTRATGHQLDRDAVDGMMRIATVPEGSRVTLVRRWLASVHVPVDGGPGADGGSAVVMLPGPPGHLRAVLDEAVVPDLLDGGGEPSAVAEVEHDYPETLLVASMRRIRDRHPAVRMGSYPGQPMIVRFLGARDEVDAAAAALREALDGLDSDPSARAVRDAWQQSPAWTAS